MDQARTAYAAQPSPRAQLALGEAQVRAGQDTAARATLRPLTGTSGDVGDLANLYDAAAADQLGDLAGAHQGYSHWLAQHDDGAVRARLGDVDRRLADSAARAAIASERSLDAASLPERTVGVAPLQVTGGDSTISSLGFGLADLLITDLSRSAQLQVVDRTRTDALLRELTLAGSGRVDSATAPRVGRLIGARRIVNGVVDATPGDRLTVSTRVADAAQGTLVGQPVTERTSLDDILDSEKALAFSLFTELGVTLTPAERAAVEQRPTRYLAAFLAYSKGVRAEAYGDYRTAHAYYARAVMIDPGFSAAASRMQSVSVSSDQQPDVTTASAAATAPVTPGSVIDALNPSPAGSLGSFRDRGDATLRATTESKVPGSITIPVAVP
ncbi:MAG TPA: CsgG/HfaB family protein [Gemmatimonadaceae bacterium]